MKKLVGLLLALSLCCNLFAAVGFSGKGGAVSAAPESYSSLESAMELQDRFDEADRDVNVGYLLRENFSPYGSAGSGWKKANMPGGASISTIKSMNTKLETYIEKAFVGQSGEVTAELKVISVSPVENGYLTVLGEKDGKTVNAVQIKIEDDVLKFVTASGEKITAATMGNAVWTGLKITANPAENKVTLYVNGREQSDISDTALSIECDKLVGLRFGINAASKGAYTLGTVSVYKGYDVHETLGVAGIKTEFDIERDYNSGATATCTVDDHSIQNDNAHLAHLALDGDDDTYWEHNKDYPISKNAYFMVSYGSNIVPVDTVRLKFAGYYKGAINVTYQKPDDAWDGWGSGKYSWVRYETTDANGYELILELEEPQWLVSLAIGFMVGTDDYNIAEQEIKLASFEAKCVNPPVIEMPSFPSDWSKTAPADTVAETHAFYGGSSAAEFNVFRIADDNETESVKVRKDFARQGNITAEFSAYFKDKADGNRLGIENENGDFAGIVTKNGKFNVCVNFAGNETLAPLVNSSAALTAMPEGVWVRFCLKYDSQTHSLTVDYNGWQPIGAVSLDGIASDKWTAFVAESAEGVTEYMFDNVKVYATQAQSNVPALEKCDTGDTVLTMQACSLWREGTHIGWEALDNENMYYRQPVLGWYDEGTPEVADWEIKMAVDHGISNFMYCWYRYSSTSETVLGSNYADEIWDGLFKSKFRNDINFSIMFENAGGSMNGYDDLVQNLMPYWIETFFKNPNYQKTADGKPIFYIYSYTKFIDGVGDVNNDGKVDAADAKSATDKMREMCVNAGLAGLYLVAEDRMISGTAVRAIENCGFDSLFAYTFSSGTYNNGNDSELAHAQNVLLSQRAAVTDTAAFSVIPNISKSWDTRGWTEFGFGNASANYMYDLEHYREYALWVKNVFGGAEIDGTGTKMIMLDNWNEYSEGHWLMPTFGTAAYKNGKYAYGYLDVLREVFGIGEYAHTDYLPLEEGFGPYDTWYPAGWGQTTDIYSQLFGKATDDSVRETEIMDWEIGYDTVGGNTAYVRTVAGNSIDVKTANRVVLKAEALATLKSAGKGLTVNMLNGSVTLAAQQLDSLDEGKSLEIVFNVQTDITEIAVAVRKAANGAYRICDGCAYTFSLKQGGHELADYEANIAFASVPEKATGYALYAGGNLQKADGAMQNGVLTVKNNSHIIFTK